MRPIGGSNTFTVEKRVLGERDSVGGRTYVWVPVDTLNGFLDYQSGDYRQLDTNSKLADTTHILMCDYKEVDGLEESDCRIINKGKSYNILKVDNPMGLDYHLEIYLQYLGVPST